MRLKLLMGMSCFLLLDCLDKKVQSGLPDLLFFSLLYQWLEHFGFSNKSCDSFVQTFNKGPQWCHQKQWNKTVCTCLRRNRKWCGRTALISLLGSFVLFDKVKPCSLHVSFLLLTVLYNSSNLVSFSSIIFFYCS